MTRPCSCCACCVRVEADAGDDDAAAADDDVEDPPPVEQLVRAAVRATAAASTPIFTEARTAASCSLHHVCYSIGDRDESVVSRYRGGRFADRPAGFADRPAAGQRIGFSIK